MPCSAPFSILSAQSTCFRRISGMQGAHVEGGPFEGLDLGFRNFSSSDVLQIHIVFISLAFGTCIGLPWRLQHSFAIYATILFYH